MDRPMITAATSTLAPARVQLLLDICCGDGFLASAIAGLEPRGGAVLQR